MKTETDHSHLNGRRPATAEVGSAPQIPAPQRLTQPPTVAPYNIVAALCIDIARARR